MSPLGPADSPLDARAARPGSASVESGDLFAGKPVVKRSPVPRHRLAPELTAGQLVALRLALAGESHASYPDWIGRFHELDPVRVHFAHDRAIWERDVAESIR